MPDYLVEWDVDVFDVGNPREAAEKALGMQRNPYSPAVVFRVTNTETGAVTVIDMDEPQPGMIFSKKDRVVNVKTGEFAVVTAGNNPEEPDHTPPALINVKFISPRGVRRGPDQINDYASRYERIDPEDSRAEALWTAWEIIDGGNR